MSGTFGGGQPAQPERWSPFPVQDWSTLPSDPYEITPRTDFVDLSWGPPTPRRSGWLPIAVIVAVLTLLAGSLWAADSSAGPSPTAAAKFLPGDGAASYQNRQTRRTTGTEHEVMVTESARLSGSAAVLSLDYALGARVFGALNGDSPAGHRFWRTTTTDATSTAAGEQTTSVYLVDRSIELLVTSGPGIVRTYTPGLVELPADVAAGQRWSSRGRSGELDYAAEFEATQDRAAAGCLSVTGTITFTTKEQLTAGTQGQTTTWCPGAGIVARSFSFANLTVVDQPTEAPAAPTNLRLVADPTAWSDPAAWRPRTATAMSIDPNFGQGELAGVPGAAPPVLAASGLLIRPSSNDDLIALTPKTQDAWTSVWRMRPGGQVLSLAAFGDVIVVTTSQRRMIGYRDTGVRLWSRDLSDVAFRSPVRTSRSEAAVVDAAGSLSVFDLVTGTVRWQSEVGAEVIASPIAGSGTVVIIDGSDVVHAYDAADGSQRWSVNEEVKSGIVLGDQVVVHNNSTLMALSLADGRYRWLVPTPGTVLDLQVLGNDLVLATRLGTSLIDSEGRVLAKRPSYLVLTADRNAVIGWGGTQAEVLDTRLQVLTTWDTPDQTNASSEIKIVADREGVWRFGEDWTMTGWSGQP